MALASVTSSVEFMWFNSKLGASTVTIADYGLVFSRAAVEELKKPDRVLLGFDKSNRYIAVKPVSNDDPAAEGAFIFAERLREGYVRINSKDFIRRIRPFVPGGIGNTAKKYLALWDEDLKLMVIDLYKDITEDDSDEGDNTPTEDPF